MNFAQEMLSRLLAVGGRKENVNGHGCLTLAPAAKVLLWNFFHTWSEDVKTASYIFFFWYIATWYTYFLPFLSHISVDKISDDRQLLGGWIAVHPLLPSAGVVRICLFRGQVKGHSKSCSSSKSVQDLDAVNSHEVTTNNNNNSLTSIISFNP